jgi:Predicted nucleotide-binding protein containing TIR-like domain
MTRTKTIFIASASEDTAITMMISDAIRDAKLPNTLSFNLEPKPWFKEELSLNQSILQSLVKFPNKYDYGCFLFTPRDALVSNDLSSMRVRDNVIFEFGLFAAQKDGIHKSFIIQQDDINLKLASDLSGIVTAKYTHTDNPQVLNANIKFSVTRIINAIEEFENELKDRSTKALDTCITKLKSELEITKMEDHPKVILNSLMDLAEIKAEVLDQTVSEVLRDLLTWTNTVVDISDLDDLLKLQQGELECVWIYSSKPIEFDSNPKNQNLRTVFRDLVLRNLDRGTKYLYFTDTEEIINSIKEFSDFHSENLEIFVLDSQCVTSNFAFHFYKDKTFSVFQNIVRRGLLESLIKLDMLDANILVNKISSQFSKFTKSKEGSLYVNRRISV